MDETNIPFCPRFPTGFINKKARKQKRHPRSLQYPAKPGDVKASFSHVCFVCDDSRLQPLLPQVLLVNKKTVTADEMDRAQRLFPSNVIVLYDKTHWMSADTLSRILEILSALMKAHAPGSQIILSIDCCRAHIAQLVWKTCARCKMFLHLIPAKMTWALQPCDTHVVARLKHRLRMHCVAAALATTTGKLNKVDIFAAFSLALQEIVNDGDWEKAFLDVGLTGYQSGVSKRVLAKTCLESQPFIGAEMPTLADLRSIWPKGIKVSIDDVFHVYLGAAPAEPWKDYVAYRAICRAIAAADLPQSVPALSAAASCPEAATPTWRASRTPPPVTPVAPPPLPPPELPAQATTRLRLPSRARLPPVRPGHWAQADSGRPSLH